MKWLLKTAYIVLSFFAIDATLRVLTRWLGYYSIYELPPNLFSLCWSVIWIVALAFPARKVGRVIYAVLYALWAFYAIAQYVYYLIFNKFFFLADMLYAAEGADFAGFVLQVIDVKVVGMLLLFALLGVIGFVVFPDFRILKQKTRALLQVGCAIVAGVVIWLTPSLYSEAPELLFANSAYEYRQFTNAAMDMEIAGVYQYVAKDAWRTMARVSPDKKALKAQVDSLLQEKHEVRENAYTGLLAGKNLVLVQLESIDDWAVHETTMPTLNRLMQEGINLTNFYTPLYGNGWTFSTEFAVNTGIYQSTHGTAAYSNAQNTFTYSLANILKEQGYGANALHENRGTFYNRMLMYPAFGYPQYNSAQELVSESENYADDATLVRNEKCWELIRGQDPWMGFVITYSAHIPYTRDDPLAAYALEKHPECDVDGRSDELNVFYAKAKLTDDMFAELIARLKAEDQLEDTVIIAYADHCCYGLTDKQELQRLSEENGSSILEKTPAFIWYEGCEAQQIDKVCQTIDLLPTIANLFGVQMEDKVLGHDILSDAYEGYAIFPNGTWLTNDAYSINGRIQWNHGMSQEEIDAMNLYVQRFYEANEAILESDYYRK